MAGFVVQKNDVTTAVREAVEKMIAKAAVVKNRGKPFEVDFEKVQFFIQQQVELVPDDTMTTPGVIYRDLRFMHNCIEKTLKVPISHSESSQLQDTKVEADIHAEVDWKRKDGSEVVDKYHSVVEGEVAGNVAATYIPREEKLYNIPLKLRALKIAKVRVYRKSRTTAKKSAKVGAGIGAALGGPLGIGFGALIGGGATSLRSQVRSVTLTAQEIFAEGNECEDDKEKDWYVTCVVRHSLCC